MIKGRSSLWINAVEVGIVEKLWDFYVYFKDRSNR